MSQRQQPPPPPYSDDKAQTQGNSDNDGYAGPPPYHNWQDAVPDTAEFPPPPAISLLYSETGNASEDDADRAHAFCNAHPLWKPSEPVYDTRSDVELQRPPEFRGSLTPHLGRWRGRSSTDCPDCVLISNLPLYFPVRDSPFVTERSKTIYFEVKIVRMDQGARDDASGLSIGFLAQPYPTWRSPGWERASIGVFSDDGCRFANDSFGGKPFTEPFRVGETVGLGMTFQLPEALPHARPACNSTLVPQVRVFFTRDGQDAGGWDLHEEVDVDAGGVHGLEGTFDLYGAVGIFGGVEFEACFKPDRWLWKPNF